MDIKTYEQNKNCDNCKFFVRHYGIFNGRVEEIIGCGHCTCNQLKFNSFYRISKYELPCKYWEETESGVLKRETVEKDIAQMSERLNEILQILKT